MTTPNLVESTVSQMTKMPEMTANQELISLWRKQARNAEDEANRIDRTIKRDTGAADRCRTQARFLYQCASDLERLVAIPSSEPQPQKPEKGEGLKWGCHITQKMNGWDIESPTKSHWMQCNGQWCKYGESGVVRGLPGFSNCGARASALAALEACTTPPPDWKEPQKPAEPSPQAGLVEEVRAWREWHDRGAWRDSHQDLTPGSLYDDVIKARQITDREVRSPRCPSPNPQPKGPESEPAGGDWAEKEADFIANEYQRRLEHNAKKGPTEFETQWWLHNAITTSLRAAALREARGTEKVESPTAMERFAGIVRDVACEALTELVKRPGGQIAVQVNINLIDNAITPTSTGSKA